MIPLNTVIEKNKENLLQFLHLLSVIYLLILKKYLKINQESPKELSKDQNDKFISYDEYLNDLLIIHKYLSIYQDKLILFLNDTTKGNNLFPIKNLTDTIQSISKEMEGQKTILPL